MTATKLGSSRVGAAARRDQFVEEFFIHGENATQAALACGYSPKTATSQGSDLLRHPEVVVKIAARREQLLEKSKLSAEEVLIEMANLVRLDPAKFFDPATNQLLPVHLMPAEVRKYIGGFDIDTTSRTQGTGGKTKTTVTTATAKIKMPSKKDAIEMALRHFGLFAKDKQGYNPDDETEAPLAIGVTIDFKDARRRKAS